MVVLVLLDFLGCLVLRETLVSLVHRVVQVSLALKESLVSLVPPVFLVASAHLGPLVRLCLVRKESKVHPVHLEEQVNLDHRVLVDPREAVV